MSGEWRSIGKLSKETGVKVPTIRFYEQIGLLPQPHRTDGDWRLYGDDARQRLDFIRHARDLGFSVDDIRGLLSVAAHPEQPCADADAITRVQLGAVEQKIEQLISLRDELRRMLESCSGGVAAECRIIEALSERAACPTHAHD